MDTLPRPSRRVAAVAIVLIAGAIAFQVFNAPSLNGWRRDRVASLSASSFHRDRSAKHAWVLISPEFELDGDAPAYLVADAGRLPEGELGVSVVDRSGSSDGVGLQTPGRWFSGDSTFTSFGQQQILQYEDDLLCRLVAPDDEAAVTSDRVMPSPPGKGQYRLALTLMGRPLEPPDATFVVSQVRGYVFQVPLEDWVLMVAGLIGYLLLRRYERRHESGEHATFPLALQIVAWVAIWAGVSSLASLAGSDPGRDPFSILGIWAGIDLLRLRSGWRSVLLFVFWLFILGEVAGLIGTLVYGWPAAQVGLSVALGLFFFWQYRVLVRPGVKALFEAADARRRALRAVPTGMLVCRGCGGLVPFGATVCPRCGAEPLPTEPDASGAPA